MLGLKPESSHNEPTVTLIKVVPMPREESLIKVFENNTYSVVNIFDITLQVLIHCPSLCTLG